MQRQFNWMYKLLLLSLILVGLAGSSCKELTGLSESEVEQAIFQLVNKHRLSIQLGQLSWNPDIAVQCREHSDSMASGLVGVGHDGFDTRVKNIRAVIAGAATVAENVAFITGHSEPADQVVNQWLSNQGHRVNIEGNYDLTAVGVVKKGSHDYYITQIFVELR